MSADHYLRDFAYCHSVMIPWFLVAELSSVKSMKLSDIVMERIEAYPSSGEINSKLTNLKVAIARVRAEYVVLVDETDGISLQFENWRFNHRSSNTWPVERLKVESRKDIPLMVQKRMKFYSYSVGNCCIYW